MTRVIEFDELGGPDRLRLVDRDVPDPGKGEVQVAMAAAGLNRAELLFVAGRYLVDPVLPGSPLGAEGAGTVVKVGPGVEGSKEGDRVAVTPAIDMSRTGVLADLANVPASALVPVPDGVSFTDAAAFWMAHGTAYGMMVLAGGLRAGAGQTVVVTGASSAVGTAAFQIARAHGTTVIATSRTHAKTDRLKALGADHVIATDEEDVAARIHHITDGHGFDIACDSIAGPLLAPLAEAAAPEATIVMMGIQTGEVPPLPFYPLLVKGLTVTGFHLVWRMLDHPERRAVAVEHLNDGLARGVYRPVIDRTFGLEDVANAYRHMASNTQIGKIVVAMGM